MPIIRVALDVPLPSLFDYACPEGTEIIPGQRVLVPFGRKQMVGVAMECAVESTVAVGRIKPVERVLDEVPPLPGYFLDLLRFCSDYYHYPLGAAVMSALPTRLRSDKAVTFKEAALYALSESGRSLDLDRFPKRQIVQRRIIMALQDEPLSAAQLRSLSPSAPAAIRKLMQDGWVETVVRADKPVALTLNSSHVLNAGQQQAVDAVGQSSGYKCYLLLGITGSGKTETYMHLIHRHLQQGGQVLMLVPEINLTPQLENYILSRFPDAELASLHSGLANGERTQNWLRAQSGQAHIVLGTRLAAFTPMPRLSLIIVDEEHDASFKQQEGLRYSARDVAIFRASQAGIPIVLGSATPSLESYHNAQGGRYGLLELTERAAARAQLPVVHCISTGGVNLQDGISEKLFEAIEKRLQRGEQSLVFINRRGYAPVLMCKACGWMSDCPHCAGRQVLHLQDRRLHCHHCGYQERVPSACPSCGNADLQPVGAGTQRVESALQERFPKARILRVDRDSTRNKGAWNAMRRQIHDAEVDILVGTQMLAKGHDFPNLTLVGVINPDSALYSADFRAPEKLYAQLSQVAGRAGRAGKPGEVLIQTAFPEHPLFRALNTHDYKSWAQTQLTERQEAGFPPFTHQAMLRAEGKQEQAVYAFLQRAREAAVALGQDVEIYEVVPAAMPLRANHFRAQLLVQCVSRKRLQQFLHGWKPALDAQQAHNLRWSLDVDPLNF